MSDKNVHALLYARVSTLSQANEGISLGAQERTLRQAAELAGYNSVELIREEGRSGKSIKGRPALRDALGRLSSGSANALFVTRIDRLARSTQDFLTIVDHAHKYNWRLVLLDLNLDTSSYQGKFVVTVMSALAEMERGIISERQKDVHQERREQGLVWGKDLGPRKRVSKDIEDRVILERNSGASLRQIAAMLNRQNVPTVLGKLWTASTVKHVLNSVESSEGK